MKAFDEWMHYQQPRTPDLQEAFSAGHAIGVTEGRSAGIAWAERFTAEQCIEVIKGCGITIFHIDGQIKMQNQIVKAIKEKFGLEI